jgi:threonine synthase
VNVSEIALQGAEVYRVNGLIDDCGKIVGEGAEAGWFDTFDAEGALPDRRQEDDGLELAEQLGWDVPDVIFYPTGGGTGLIGMWKAFDELEAIGFIGSKRPRMVAVQAEGCAPMVRALARSGAEHAPRWENAHTIASGIRVPQAIGDFLILRAVRESGGFAIAVGRRDHFAGGTRRRARRGCCCAPRARRPTPPTRGPRRRPRLFNCASGRYPLPCCSTARTDGEGA